MARRELPVLGSVGLTTESTEGTEAGACQVPDASDAADDTRELWAALCEVRDPELPISIVDLGIVYGIRREGRGVQVDLTFTATACPCMMFIQEDVRERLLLEDEVDDVAINVVWDPPWTRAMMTEKARVILRRYGVAA